MKNENEVILNGVTYVKKNEQAMEDGKPYVIVRGQSSGVFAGILLEEQDRAVVLKNARRLWYWKGAASLSQLAEEGVKSPNECKFPCEISKIKILDAIEIINTTVAAKKSIQEVFIWKV